MKEIPLSPERDFLERVGTASLVNAVSELIWNGFDAEASIVEVEFLRNPLGGLDSIKVWDNGAGIDNEKVAKYFGSLGESWKRGLERQPNGRAIHGKNGEGRFKAFSVGTLVTWETHYKDAKGDICSYSIVGRSVPTYTFGVDDPVVGGKATGTTVLIQNILPKHDKETTLTPDNFAKIFAGYLSKNPTLTLSISGTRINPSDYFTLVETKALSPIVSEPNRPKYAIVEIVEWTRKIDREINLCDDSGIELYSVEARLRGKDLNFTVRIKSDYLRELDKQNRLRLENLDPELDGWLEESRDVARKYIRKRKAEEQRGRVQRWKNEKIYPYLEETELSPIEQTERQVFDIVGASIEDFLPEFETLDPASKKFTFRLLAQAIKNNPESLQRIITEVLNLKKEHQEELAQLLTKTDLTNIIKASKTVSNRLDFLVGLENLLFDKETKNIFLERDQLHKILEKEAWIFDENFVLTSSEAKLEEVLQEHLALLGKRFDDDSPVVREGGKRGRVDLMLSLANRPRLDEMDHLIVELKRPSQKIDSVILGQIESYAVAVSKDPRFDITKTKWKFIVVSNEIDPFALERARQRDRKPGLTFESKEGQVEVWAFTWTEILSNARTRLEFINKSLAYRADRDSAKDYLIRTHQKYIPIEDVESDPEIDNGSGE